MRTWRFWMLDLFQELYRYGQTVETSGRGLESLSKGFTVGADFRMMQNSYARVTAFNS